MISYFRNRLKISKLLVGMGALLPYIPPAEINVINKVGCTCFYFHCSVLNYHNEGLC